ncbi:hypothetical protein K437DRAFT_274292 [Tilletiaria anomala UBC 951]|uniref:Uncharacterized protein n=1 Tax=Tilletiaria anomala (strain ATCC 24038 / CBS 436.72 / UBC 951) TaxID=1037660 RepID=A0A066W2B8_TILAU|nr:uncharacterized protein K437DRAFT_274292 [Tilletiaria anomala UBC 951]KDN45229.1 hypothetical protein K437DRAFT_274292 [Tilletiaria anomala UBC 951]
MSLTPLGVAVPLACAAFTAIVGVAAAAVGQAFGPAAVQSGAASLARMPAMSEATPDPLWDGAKVRRQLAEDPDDSSGPTNRVDTLLPTSASDIAGQPSPTFIGEPHDPLLALIPSFAFSMPAQIFINGMNLSLMIVLAVHLSFTTRYHFPLSKQNFLLQAGSTTLLLASLISETAVILKELKRKSHRYPYMFPYVGVQLPPPDHSWTIVQDVFYLLMLAMTTFLAHLTHIQFLTLLFPSSLEKRLIFWMLGPLALASAGMLFTSLSPDSDYKTTDLGDAIRNICNSTLTLLYFCALLIWGLLVNRRRAWRTDGGTAAFGGGAVGLAFLNTVISFVEIAYDRLWWLQDIGWTLTVWQSWLGFWWWVGSGMGIGEVEDRELRAAKRRKRRKRLERKRRREDKERAAFASVVAERAATANGAEKVDTDSGFVGIRRLRDAIPGVGEAGGNGLAATIKGHLRRRRPPAAQHETDGELTAVEAHDGEHDEEDQEENREVQRVEDDAELAGISIAPGEDTQTSGGGSGESDPTAESSAPPGPFGRMLQTLAAHQPAFIRQRFQRLRIAHVAAARRAATQQTALRDQVLHRSNQARQSAANPGLRTMMMIEGHSSEHVEYLASSRPTSTTGGNAAGGGRPVSFPGRTRFADSSSQPYLRLTLPMALRETDQTGGSSSRLNIGIPLGSAPAARQKHTQRQHQRQQQRQQTSDDDDVNRDTADDTADDWVDQEPDEAPAALQDDAVSDAVSDAASDGQEDAQGSSQNASDSWMWRGGLKRARLRDRTTYG